MARLSEEEVFKRVVRQSLRDVPMVVVPTFLVTYFLDALGRWGVVPTAALMVLLVVLMTRLVVLFALNVSCWGLSLIVPDRDRQAQRAWALLAAALVGVDVGVYAACLYVLGATTGWWGPGVPWGGT